MNHPVVMVMNGRFLLQERKWMMKSAYIITWVNNNGDDETSSKSGPTGNS